jgi:uncharacterized membrane protein YfcA
MGMIGANVRAAVGACMMAYVFPTALVFYELSNSRTFTVPVARTLILCLTSAPFAALASILCEGGLLPKRGIEMVVAVMATGSALNILVREACDARHGRREGEAMDGGLSQRQPRKPSMEMHSISNGQPVFKPGASNDLSDDDFEGGSTSGENHPLLLGEGTGKGAPPASAGAKGTGGSGSGSGNGNGKGNGKGRGLPDQARGGELPEVLTVRAGKGPAGLALAKAFSKDCGGAQALPSPAKQAVPAQAKSPRKMSAYQRPRTASNSKQEASPGLHGDRGGAPRQSLSLSFDEQEEASSFCKAFGSPVDKGGLGAVDKGHSPGEAMSPLVLPSQRQSVPPGGKTAALPWKPGNSTLRALWTNVREVPPVLYLIGPVVGLLSGVSGTAGTFSFLPLALSAVQLGWVDWGPQEMLAHGAAMSTPITLTFSLFTVLDDKATLDLGLFLLVAVPFTVGARAGVKLAKRTRPDVIKKCMAVVLLGAGVYSGVQALK